MIILGIDPGTLVTGYGVIESSGRGVAISLVEYGTIESKRIATLPLRLHAIFTRLSAVIERVKPNEIAIESAFYHKNVQSTLKLGHARGVAMLAGILKDLPAAEYSPREIKRAVVGNGNASKEQVEYMVRSLLRLDKLDKKLPDAYDALAVAITHAARSVDGASHAAKKSWKNWKQFVEENSERIKH
ncbi:MAG TPA: crossover junction endodeoxyribonuclease RuvC [Candidatus Kapabacteria bacterium]|nr:crossover junction endodeoxyribonuclease RuvC [Candidatus Kapabacteria bacterium]